MASPLAYLFWTYLVVDFIWEVVLSHLNLRHQEQPLPASLQGLYSAEEELKAKRYLREKTHFGNWIQGVSLAVFAGFTWGGGWNWIGVWVHMNFAAQSELVRDLILVGVLGLFKQIMTLPIEIYATFSLEARYGFNTTSWKTFLGDHVKGTVLGLVIGGPLLVAIWLIHSWWIQWLGLIAFQLFLLWIAPRFLMPLFLKFTPLEDGTLKQAVMGLAEKLKFETSGIFVVDGSTRSTKANAFFAGFGKNRRIALFDTLLKQLNETEVVAVLAHEIGHAKLKHTLKQMILGIVGMGVGLYLLQQLVEWPELLVTFGIEGFESRFLSFFWALELLGPLKLIQGAVSSHFSRKHEYQADAFAKQWVGGLPLIEGLRKISKESLANLNPHPWVVALRYSHPTLSQRIGRLSGE